MPLNYFLMLSIGLKADWTYKYNCALKSAVHKLVCSPFEHYSKGTKSTFNICLIELARQVLFIAIIIRTIYLCAFIAFESSPNEQFRQKNCSKGLNIFLEILVTVNVIVNEHFRKKNCSAD